MRGSDQIQGVLFNMVNLEERVPATHPLRPMRAQVDAILHKLNEHFDRMYSSMGRPSIPPERLLRAQLIQVLFTIRSERQLMEQLNYNLMFRWFVGLGIDDPVWDPTVFSKNRDRLLAHDVAGLFFEEVIKMARSRELLSDEHFTVDGTFIEAWASHKSFKAKDGSEGRDANQSGGRNTPVDFHGQKRKNETHASTTDPDARLMSKGRTGARLVHHGHIITENRNGLVVAASVTPSTGTCEVEAGLDMMADVPRSGRATLGADKGYDCTGFVQGLRDRSVTPHVAQNNSGTRTSRVDGRTSRHPGYAISQRRRKMVEEVFGWMKTVGCLRKTRHRGTALVEWIFEFTLAAYNLVRIRNLTTPSPRLRAIG